MTSGASDAARLIALDWGTSSLRGYLLGAGGVVLDTRETDEGIMRVPAGGFSGVFGCLIADWRNDAGPLPAIASGMIGSAQGWVEAPYADCPADGAALAAGLVEVSGQDLWIVPGVRQVSPDAADVMRGEETQILGALAVSNLPVPFFVLPGTHSKWVAIADGRIAGFSTFITGELFDVLGKHSILGRLAATPAGGPRGDAAFLCALDLVRRTGHAAPLLFGTRALALTGGLDPVLTRDHLSGLLIGDELVSALADLPADTVPMLVGNTALCARYASALDRFGYRSIPAPADVTPAGLWRIAVLAGLVS